MSFWMRWGEWWIQFWVWVQFWGLQLVLLQDLSRYDQSLDLAGALVDLGDASVAVVPLGRHVRHVAHPPQDLDRLVSGGDDAFVCVRLGFCRLIVCADVLPDASRRWRPLTPPVWPWRLPAEKAERELANLREAGSCDDWRRRTLVKGFLESRRTDAFQVSRRALSMATAMSASLNWMATRTRVSGSEGRNQEFHACLPLKGIFGKLNPTKVGIKPNSVFT